MKLLLDTHLLLWAADDSDSLSPAARALIEDPANDLLFSAVSIWEISIKHGLKRADFKIEPHVFMRALLDGGYGELPLTSKHAVTVGLLPPIHKDPFDRILIAQAQSEGITLLTADPIVARYPGPVRLI
jgi:PIN domain nuclease of toxin-antitoxin system